MNIVFFLEPRIELSASFRFATLKNSILPQIKSLNKANVKTHIILGDAVENLALSDGLIQDIGDYVVIDNKKLSEISSMNYDEAAYSLHMNNNSQLRSALVAFYKNSLNHLSPDMIISWESNIDYLSDIFPNSSILYQWPGMLSRIPFPEMISFDVGLLDKSYSKCLNEYSKIQNQDIEKIKMYFSKYEEYFDLFNLVKNNLISWKSKYKKVILLPLQVDNYFTVTVPLDRQKTQFDLVEYFLDKTPIDIGVIVTEYRSKNVNCNVLSTDNVIYLKNKYKNFIDASNILDIPQISQYLVCKVDGVITISSSVGLQAAIWKKPLLTVGKSHITPFSNSSDYCDFINQVYLDEINDQYQKLFQSLSKMNICLNDIRNDPNRFKKWLCQLNDFIKNKESLKLGWPNYYANVNELIDRLESNERITNFINSNSNFFNFKDYKVTGCCNELSAQIKRKKIISFDIFDTLLVRPFEKPKDLFDFISSDVKNIVGDPTFEFSSYRLQAESLAFQESIQSELGETTFNDIYKKLKKITGLTPKQVNLIKTLEMDSEKKFLYKREVGYKAYMEAYVLGKEIILISDMYLSADTLASILKKNGYHYHKHLFVSSETKVKKSNGKMYSYVMDTLNIVSADLLHIGDNLKADIIVPQKMGIKTFHLPKTIETFHQSPAYSIWKRDSDKHSLDWKILQAIQANRLFDNPYASYRRNTLFNGDLLTLGYYGIGSMLLGFVKWIIENAILNQEKHLYFLSRDGKILYEIYKKIQSFYPKAPSASYLLCSRRAVNLAKIKTVNDIKDLVFVDYANNVTIGFILESRFGIRLEQIDVSVLDKFDVKWESRLLADNKLLLLKIVLELKELIFQQAEKERNNYIEYLESQKLYCFSKTDKIGIVDIGYAGTMQESLYKISGYNLSGYYFITFRKALERVVQNNMKIYGYQASFIDRHDTYHPFCKFVPLYETFFSNQDTSLVRFEKNLNNKIIPIFMSPINDEEYRIIATSIIHIGVNRFVDDMLTALGGEIVKIDIEPNKTLRLLNHYFSDPHPRDAELLCNIKFEDAYGGGGNKLLLPSKQEININCIWINGQKSLRRDISFQKSDFKTKKITNIIEKPNNKSIKIKYKIAYLILSERKYRKLIREPETFTNDIKNHFMKKIASFLFK